jgi:tripartite-type tricarboxylate transporter receptor subunit TctC
VASFAAAAGKDTPILKRLVIALAHALALGLATTGTALAQAYPAKPVRLIIPFPPGGSADTIARLLAQEMSKSLGSASGATSSSPC